MCCILPSGKQPSLMPRLPLDRARDGACFQPELAGLWVDWLHHGVFGFLSVLCRDLRLLCVKPVFLSRKDHGWGKAQASWTICHP